MIFVLAKDLQATSQKAAQHVSQQSELFKAMGSAALRARAGMLEPGKVVAFGGFEFVVDEDEFGEWVVIQIIVPRKEIEELGKAKAEDLGIDKEKMSVYDHSLWISDFMDRLKELLKKWQDIKCHVGPGENLTFEKAAYRKGAKDWR
jgi:hypothetical protein